MRTFRTAFALAATAAALAAAPAFAGEDVNPDAFVKMCDMDKDGMVSKQEAMKMIEKMFDKADAKKTGKLDKKQVEIFLHSLMQSGG